MGPSVHKPKSKDSREPPTAPAAVRPPASVDFPRGGGSVLTPIEYRQAAHSRPAPDSGPTERKKRTRAAADELAPASRKRATGARDGAKSPAIAKRRETTVASLGAWATSQAPQRVDPLSFKRVSEGMRVLGIVREVHSTKLVVSLPNNVSGRVAYAEASDAHASLWRAHQAHAGAEGGASVAAPELPALSASFSVGELVRCVVVAVVRKASKRAADGARTRKGLSLSLRLGLLQPSLSADELAPGALVLASVQSIEEHGAVLALGPPGLTGFLHADRIEHDTHAAHAAPDARAAANAPDVGLGALAIGRVLLCSVVPGARRAGIVPCAYARRAEIDTLTSASDAVTLATLRPGALVVAKVNRAVAGGLLATAAEFFASTLELLQLPHPPAGADWAAAPQLAPGAKLRARVLFVDLERKTVALSARAELLALAPGADAHRRAEAAFGARVDATVVAAVPRLGVVATVTVTPAAVATTTGDGPDGAARLSGARRAADAPGRAVDRPGAALCALAPLAQLSDELAAALDKSANGARTAKGAGEQLARASARALGAFAPGGAPRAGRVIGYSPLEGALLLSFKKSALASGGVAFGELRAGDVHEGTIKTVGDYGAIVSLGQGIDGLVAKDHLGTAARRALDKRRAGAKGVKGTLTPGDAVTVCVLSVDAPSRKLSLSLLRELVRSTLPRVTRYDEASPGLVTHGVVTGVRPFGCVVSFYAGVRGVVRAAELRATHGDVWDDTPKACYALGQAVRVRVVSVEPAKARMCLSFSLDPAKAAAAAKAAALGAAPRAGPADDDADADAVGAERAGADGAAGAGTVAASDVQAREGSVVCARVTAVRADRYELTLEGGPLAERAELPFAHCCDIVAHAAPMGGAHRVGDVLDGLLVVGASGGRHAERVLALSAKPSLLDAARAAALPTDVTALAPGRTLSGYVHALAPYGAFVRFGSADASLLVPKREMADGFVTDVAEHVAVGQSVRVRVLPPPAGSGSARPIGSLRHNVGASDHDLVALLHALAAEKRALAAAAHFDAEGAYTPGALVSATVLEHKPYGLVLSLPDGCTGLVTRAHAAAGVAAAAPDGAVAGAVAGALPAVGSAVDAVVLDADAARAIIDCSLRAELVRGARERAAAAAAAAASAAGARGEGEPSKKRRKGERGKERVAAAAAPAPAPAPVDGALAGAAPPPPPLPGVATTAVVELVRDEYAVVSLPHSAHAIGYVLTVGYNDVRSGAAAKRYALGQKLRVVVAPPPPPSPSAAVARGARGEPAAVGGASGGAPRGAEPPPPPILLRIARARADGVEPRGAGAARASVKLAQTVSDLRECVRGALVRGRVIGKTATQLNVRLGKALRARVHLAEVADAGARATFDAIDKGATLTAVVIAVDAERSTVELSIRPSELAAAKRAARSAIAAGGARRAPADGAADADGAAADGADGVGARGAPYEPVARPTIDTIVEGEIVDAVVREASDEYAWLFVGPHVTGRAFCLELSDDLDVAARPRAHFAIGDAVRARVLAADVPSARVDLSLRLEPTPTVGPSGARAGVAHRLPVEGAVVLGRISRVLPGAGTNVQLTASLHGRVHLTECADGWPDEPTAALQLGMIVRAAVMHVDADVGQVDLSLRADAVNFALERAAPPPARVVSAGALERGQRVCGYVKRTDAPIGVFVTLSRGIDALIPLAHLSDDFLPSANGVLAAGALVRARVLSANAATKRVTLTMRPSLLVDGAELPDEGAAARRAEPSGGARTAGGNSAEHLAHLDEGAVVTGVVRRVERFGVFISIDEPPVSGLAHLSELTGKFVEDAAKLYRVGERVQAIVLSVDVAAKRVALSLRAELLRAAAEAGAEAAAGVAGAASAAGEAEDEDGAMTVKRSRDVRRAIEDEVLDAGDDAAKDDDAASEVKGSDDGPSDDDDDEEEEADDDDDDDDEADSEVDADDDADDDDDGDDDGDDDDDVVTMNARGSGAGAGAGAGAGVGLPTDVGAGAGAIAGGFEWDDFSAPTPHARARADAAAIASNGSADGAGDGHAASAATDARDADAQRRARREARRTGAVADEAQLQERERALADGTAAPVSADDFERLLAAAPDSAYVWVKFMAFHLSLADVERARAVAERALKSINFRKLDEKKNVWVALLNLEKAHGSAESLAGVFKRACADQNAKHLYLLMAAVHERAADAEAVGKTYDAACKHYKASKKVWLAKMEWLMRTRQPDAAKATLERALHSLARRKHVATIVKFAQLEYRHGSLERARTVMDGVMAHHPNRLDLWSVYLDMETRKGAGTLVPDVRRLFERVSSTRLSSKKMKYVLKRWLDWEAVHGDAETMGAVKQRARDYVQLKAGGEGVDAGAAAGADDEGGDTRAGAGDDEDGAPSAEGSEDDGDA